MKLIHSRAALLGALAVSFSSLAATASAAGVLYFSDYSLQTNALDTAIDNLSLARTNAVDEADFVTQLGAGGWDVVVLLVQNNPQVAAQTALEGWVIGGGKSIYADWTLNASTALVFNAAFTSNVNNSSITHGGSMYFAGASDPMTLSNPGWGIYSLGLSALAGGTGVGMFENGDAASVVGNSGRTIMNGWLNDTYDGGSMADHVLVAEQQLQQVMAVPEPGTMLALGLGLAAAARKRRKK